MKTRVLRVRGKHCDGEININIKITAKHLANFELDTVKRDLANRMSDALRTMRYIGFDVTEVKFS
jgi:hypothetical protein